MLCLLAGSLLFIRMMVSQEVKLSVPLKDIFEPRFVLAPASNGGSLFTDPEGIIRFLYRVGPGHEGSGAYVYQDVSYDGGQTWQLGQVFVNTGEESQSEIAEVNPYSGEIYLMYTRDGGRMIRTIRNRTEWSKEIKLPFSFDYTTGNLVWLRKEEDLGYHRMIAAVPDDNGVVTYRSDDDGITWNGPSNLITSPSYPGRWRNPAASPQIIELKNRKLWMLTRNSQDHLWEYFSDDRGISWSEGRPSRFVGVFSNVRLKRIPDGRLLILWLNAMPWSGISREGSFHNTARDVLHAAVSDDEGATWRGFREVMLDSQRHSLVFSRLPANDAGVHHQKFTVTRDNKVVVFSGQDDDTIQRETGHRKAVIFDIDWLYETRRSTNFSLEYEDLCVFKLSERRRKGTNYYSRVLGATLIAHPTKAYRKVLYLGRERCDWVLNEQDGACWNFSAGKTGRLGTRFMLRKGFKGGALSLTNVFFAPSDNRGEDTALYVFDIPEDGQINVATRLATDIWYDLELAWDGTTDKDTHFCWVSIDGVQQAMKLRLQNTSRDGISYVRFRSTASEEDLAGFLVEFIDVEVR